MKDCPGRSLLDRGRFSQLSWGEPELVVSFLSAWTYFQAGGGLVLGCFASFCRWPTRTTLSSYSLRASSGSWDSVATEFPWRGTVATSAYSTSSATTAADCEDRGRPSMARSIETRRGQTTGEHSRAGFGSVSVPGDDFAGANCSRRVF